MPLAPEYLHLVFPDMVFHALLYGRNSRDPNKKGNSVEAQLTDGRSLCARFDWPIIEEFKDPGLSASRHARRERDDFEALLETIENGPVVSGVTRIVVAYEASRYYRDLEAYVRLRNACYHANVLLCYNNTVYDLSKREDRKATAQDAIAAEDEVEGIRDRNVRTARQTADKGAPWGKIPFGYRRKYDPDTGELIGQFEHEDHGPMVVKCLQHIDSGGSLHSLLKWLRSEPKAERPDGAKWNDNKLKYMLLNRAYLGERVHHGRTVKATWAALRGLDTPEGRAMFRRVTKVLTAPGRGKQFDSRAKHWLTRIPLCGQCGDDYVLKWDQIGGSDKARFFYRCSEKWDISITDRLLDAFVEQAVITWLSNKEQARAALIPDQRESAAKVTKDQELLSVYQDELTEARRLAATRNEQGRPLLSLASLSATELELMPKIEELENRLQKATGVPLLVQKLLAATDPEAMWNGTADEPGRPGSSGLSLEQKREAVRQLVTIRVYSGKGKPPISKRVKLSFVGTPDFRAPQNHARASVPAQQQGRIADREVPGTG
ncbi:recombinase family protein [Streptomyces sp. NPDC050095]|uniref:recombinase family protein n=1 Tax=unclassified Streptomyces TaxID=2593676 RepID=UPI0034391093